ncbi:MAG: M48 family metalloprotease [Verrucomicrobia bacterium]|nr:M48 family metalloprotease [Verrucomicrobiota bacterium]
MEFEADKFSIKLSSQAGYNKNASLRVHEVYLNLKGEEDYDESVKELCEKFSNLWSPHPRSKDRLKANKETIAQMKADQITRD